MALLATYYLLRLYLPRLHLLRLLPRLYLLWILPRLYLLPGGDRSQGAAVAAAPGQAGPGLTLTLTLTLTPTPTPTPNPNPTGAPVVQGALWGRRLRGLGARHCRPQQGQGAAAAQSERGGSAAVLWRQPIGMGTARLPPVAALPLSHVFGAKERARWSPLEVATGGGRGCYGSCLLRVAPC